MTNADKHQDNVTGDHDRNAKPPTKSSQSSLAMAKSSVLDYDTLVYYTKTYRTQLAACPAGFVSVLAGSPFENLKTRMQSHPFKNAFECMVYMHKVEGIRGFWAATATPLVSITVSRVAGFTIYQKSKYAIDAFMEKSTGISPLKTVNTKGTFPDLSTVGCFTLSGVITGASLAVVLTPFELIKNAAQTSVLMASDNTPRGPPIGSVSPTISSRVSTWNATKQIVQRRGVLGLWTGFRLHLLRDALGTGIYFGVYEAVKQSINSYRVEKEANSFIAVGPAGLVCGCMAWAVTYPLDTMKTRVQNTIVGSASKDAMATRAATAARSSKWKGVEMMIARSSIQNMIQMVIFEYVKARIAEMEFKDGSTDLPNTKREKGRTDRIM